MLTGHPIYHVMHVYSEVNPTILLRGKGSFQVSMDFYSQSSVSESLVNLLSFSSGERLTNATPATFLSCLRLPLPSVKPRLPQTAAIRVKGSHLKE